MSSDARSSAPSPSPLRLCACSPSTVQALDSPTRRLVLRVLLSRGAVSLSDLAAIVTAAPQAATADLSVTDEREAAVSLQHCHLPKLDAAELVSVDGRTLAPGPHRDVRDGPLTTRLLDGVCQDVWTAIAAASSDRRRVEVVAALARSGPTLTLEQLADTVDGGAHLATMLHHLHLPKLDAVGLLAYDYGNHQVSYAGRQWFGLDELAEALERTPRAGAPNASDSRHD
ncbi:DUF7344 domain-containing protein [Salinigranum halophilum]|uniref:DUF7344 domain-containing protein n=1 Tax=Salinigranum halophilum TaxID=2565931 RepID=UPI0010A82053|nr:hypothetical protein [Salinigranum halophilum]